MAEYLANAVQTVPINTPVILETSIPCNRGYIVHRNQTGIFILRGPINQCFARYQVVFNANIAVPEGGTVGPIAIALTENGEPVLTSRAIATPAAVGDYTNVTCTKIVDVPKGCCFNVSVRYVSGITRDATTVPTPTISVINSNLEITRIA